MASKTANLLSSLLLGATLIFSALTFSASNAHAIDDPDEGGGSTICSTHNDEWLCEGPDTNCGCDVIVEEPLCWPHPDAPWWTIPCW